MPKRHNGVTAGMQLIQDPRQRGDCLGTIAAGIVQQNDAAIAALLFYAMNDDVGAGLRPILRIDVFQDDEITQSCAICSGDQFAQLRWTGVGRIRRTEKRRRSAGDRFEQKLRRIQVPAGCAPASKSRDSGW